METAGDPWVPLDPSARLATDCSWLGSWPQRESVFKSRKKKHSLFPAWKASSTVLNTGPVTFRRRKRSQFEILVPMLWELLDLSPRTGLDPLERQREDWSQVSCWLLASV